MFEGANSLCPIRVSLACVIPPADQAEATLAASGSPPTNNAVVSIGHLKPDGGAHPARRVEQSAAIKYAVTAMTACVYELSATTQGASIRDKSTAKEFSNITRSENSNDR
jgi:hypothetical protein